MGSPIERPLTSLFRYLSFAAIDREKKGDVVENMHLSIQGWGGDQIFHFDKFLIFCSISSNRPCIFLSPWSLRFRRLRFWFFLLGGQIADVFRDDTQWSGSLGSIFGPCRKQLFHGWHEFITENLGLYSCYLLSMGVGLGHVETLPDNEGKKKAKRQDLNPSPPLLASATLKTSCRRVIKCKETLGTPH